VHDARSGLAWQRATFEMAMPFADATRACASLRRGGRGGFRLPTPEELSSIVLNAGGLEAGRPQYCDPAIDQRAFPDTLSDFFWTSEVDRTAGTATYVSFFDGRMHRDDVDDALRVRCVRAE
jgi:hypothetical protein